MKLSFLRYPCTNLQSCMADADIADPILLADNGGSSVYWQGATILFSENSKISSTALGLFANR